MKLTGREKSSLILEGVVTVILLLLLNMAIIVIIQDAIQSNPGVTNGIFMIKQSLKIGPLQAQIWSYQRILIALLVIIDVWVVWWRLRRRYHLYQMDHIIAELHYIAQGHLDHRIPFRLKGNQQHVITSVNALVDSAVRSMDDERKIEKSKDELIIEGNVEAAHLQSGKRIVIKNGVSGGGLAVIESADDIHGKFFEGASLTANKGIYANYVMNSNLIAGKEIVISGSKGAIIGGSAAAVNGIKAHHIGNRAGLLTNISLGVSKAMLEKEEEAELKLKKLQSELVIFEEAYKKLQKQYPPEVRNGMDLYLKVEQATYIKRKQMEQQVERTKELEEKRSKANEAKMMVYGILNAGTVVQMNGMQWTAASSVRNVTVRLSNKEIGIFRN